MPKRRGSLNTHLSKFSQNKRAKGYKSVREKEDEFEL